MPQGFLMAWYVLERILFVMDRATFRVNVHDCLWHSKGMTHVR